MVVQAPSIDCQPQKTSSIFWSVRGSGHLLDKQHHLDTHASNRRPETIQA